MNRKLIFGIFILMILLVVNISSATNIEISSLEKGLVGHWTLDQDNYNSNTNRVTDKSGHENHATNSGATSTTDRFGNANSAMNFDGTTNVITRSTMVLGTAATFEAWGSATTLTTKMLWNHPGNINSAYFDLFFYNNIISMNTGDSANNPFKYANGTNIPSSMITLNQWHHYVVVADPVANKALLYYDGVNIGNATYKDPTSTTSKTFSIGGASSYRWSGAISGMKIYNRVLSSTEIKQAYDSNKPQISGSSLEKGLVGHWTLDQNNYNSNTNRVTDKSGHENHATNYGATSTTDRFGNTNSAMNFNVKRMSTGLNTAFNDFTVAVWFKDNADNKAYERLVDKSYSTGFWLGRHNNNANSWGGGIRQTASPYGIYITLPDGEWNHIVFRREGTNHSVIGNGGQVFNSQIVTGAALSTSSLGIGSWGDGTASTQWFTGDVDDVRIYNRALSADEVKLLYESHKPQISGTSLNKGLIGSWKLTEENYNNNTKRITDKSAYEHHAYLDGGEFATNHLGTENNALALNQNLETLFVNYRTWKDGQTGSVTGFSQTGSTSENFRIIGTDPWGNDAVVWEARSDAVSGPDGGWNGAQFNIDNTKTYRFSYWVNRKVRGANGHFYAGLYSYNSAGSNVGAVNLAGTTNTNPYFWIGAYNVMPENQWMLVIAHVHPHDYTGSTHPDSSRYYQNGTIIGSISSDFKWLSTSVKALHRTYLYYSTDTSVRQQWIYPRVDLIDGNEPSLQELLDGFSAYGDSLSSELSETPTSTSFWYKNPGASTWTHVVNSSGTTYVNSAAGTPAYYPIINYNGKIYIGRTTFSDYFVGNISNIHIYNRALSQNEIDTLYMT